MDLTDAERRLADYRAKYTQDQVDALGAKGQAFKNADGHYSYPIVDKSDLSNAVHAVGRGGADHNAIRKYIIGRAKDLGASSMIPENWGSDGSIKTSDSESVDTRTACPGCGSVNPAQAVDGEMRCPDCDTYRGDVSPKGANADDGTYTGGEVNAPGLADGTGSVSSHEPVEGRSGSCGCDCPGCTGGTSGTGPPPHGDDDGSQRDVLTDAEVATVAASYVATHSSLTKVFTPEAIAVEVARQIQAAPILLKFDGKAVAEAVVEDMRAKGFITDGTDGTPPINTQVGAAVPSAPATGDLIDSDADGVKNATGSGGPGVDGEDGSAGISDGTDVGDGSTPPHPSDDGAPDGTTDPNVDEGDSVDDGNPFPDNQLGDADGAHGSPPSKRFKARHSSTPAPKAEHRALLGNLESRSGGSSGPVLEGMAIRYNTPYTVYDAFGAFTERMDPAVCNAVLARGDLDCRYLLNHDGIPFARTTSGTLELPNTAEGLNTVAHLSATSHAASDLADAVARRDITQMSCGFRVAADEWDDDYMNRTIYSFADLLDVSPVTYPASPTTSVDIAKRMLFSLSVEARGSVAQAYNVVCDVRPGAKLDNECSNAVLRALETLYSVDDPRVPLVRVREAWKIARDIRAGKTLSNANAAFIAAALESLHRADDVDIPGIVRSLQDIDIVVDAAQAALAKVSGLPNPDGDDADQDPTLTDEGEGMRSLEQAAERRKRAAKAQRQRLAIKARPRRTE